MCVCECTCVYTGEDPLEESTATHTVFLAGEAHGQRSLVGNPHRILGWRSPWTGEPGGLYDSWGCRESDVTERLNTSAHRFSLFAVALFYKAAASTGWCTFSTVGPGGDTGLGFPEPRVSFSSADQYTPL